MGAVPNKELHDAPNINEYETTTQDGSYIPDSIEILPEIPQDEDLSGFTVIEKQEDTRGRLAQLYLIGFFVIMIAASLASLIIKTESGSQIDNLKEVILTISGVLSGPLGFIIGFYFRKNDQ